MASNNGRRNTAPYIPIIRNYEVPRTSIPNLQKCRFIDERHAEERFIWKEEKTGQVDSDERETSNSNRSLLVETRNEILSSFDEQLPRELSEKMLQNVQRDNKESRVKKTQGKFSTRKLIKSISSESEKQRESCQEEGSITAKQLQNLIETRTKEKRRKLVDNFIGAITLHGYAQFHEATGVRKVLWAITLAAMAFFIVRLTYLSYCPTNYYKQIIEFESEKVQEINFPTGIPDRFCPLAISRKFSN